MCDDDLSHELEVSKLKKKWGDCGPTSDIFRGAGVVFVWELWGLGGSGVELHHSTLMWIWDADQLGNTWRNPSEIIGGRVTSWKSFLFFDHSWKQFCWKDFRFFLGNSGIYKCFEVVANELNEHRTLRQTQTWTLFPVVPSVLYNPIWVFPKKRGTPKWMVKIMENPMKKWMIWGYHYIRKHPYSHPSSDVLTTWRFFLTSALPIRIPWRFLTWNFSLFGQKA